MGSPPLDWQARELDRLLSALIKRYQFRDRNSICCGTITVSQCYVMKELGRHGPLAMTDLAGRMCLAVSTLTRVVDQLERRRFVTRRPSPGDGRVRQVALTDAGASMLGSMQRRILGSERAVLAQLGAADRTGLLRGLRRLVEAIEERPMGRSKGGRNNESEAGCVRAG